MAQPGLTDFIVCDVYNCTVIEIETDELDAIDEALEQIWAQFPDCDEITMVRWNYNPFKMRRA